MKQIKQILLTGILLFCIMPVIAQVKKNPAKTRQVQQVKNTSVESPQLKNFLQIAAQANVKFIFPAGFKEIKAPDNEDFSFDYGMELPGKEFEIWLQVKSQKENWASYEKSLADNTARQANPDSLYLGLGTAHAASFTGEREFFTRNIPENIAERYHADAGRCIRTLTGPVIALSLNYKRTMLIS